MMDIIWAMFSLKKVLLLENWKKDGKEWLKSCALETYNTASQS